MFVTSVDSKEYRSIDRTSGLWLQGLEPCVLEDFCDQSFPRVRVRTHASKLRCLNLSEYWKCSDRSSLVRFHANKDPPCGVGVDRRSADQLRGYQLGSRPEQ